jgi:hypothetical protein
LGLKKRVKKIAVAQANVSHILRPGNTAFKEQLKIVSKNTCVKEEKIILVSNWICSEGLAQNGLAQKGFAQKGLDLKGLAQKGFAQKGFAQ